MDPALHHAALPVSMALFAGFWLWLDHRRELRRRQEEKLLMDVLSKSRRDNVENYLTFDKGDGTIWLFKTDAGKFCCGHCLMAECDHVELDSTKAAIEHLMRHEHERGNEIPVALFERLRAEAKEAGEEV